MARDMTLFKDDDGTAYLIYASEENYTLYISKLNDSYTDVVGWDKDGDGVRDETYQGVHGEDYIRLFPGAHREAPAMFKYNDKYYLITSGATGWDPNRAQYTVADDIFGEWKEMRDPSVGEGASTTFDSQSTFVIPVDPENGKFIFMGDRWNKDELQDSRYVWLPIEFGQDDEIILQWYDEWDLELLDRMFRVNVNTQLPEKTSLGESPDLPEVINISIENGETLDTSVNWNIQPDNFTTPGTVEITGTLPELSHKTIRTDILVIPDNVIYFVNAGGTESSDYLKWSSYMADTLLNKDVMDQKYDPDNDQTWGYVGDGTRQSVNESGDIFSALRYLLSGHGDDITYKFELETGTYHVYAGFYDPWFNSTGGSRKANILINDEIKTNDYYYTNHYDVLGYENISITDGLLDFTVQRAGSSPDPQISWIIIAEHLDDENDNDNKNEDQDEQDDNNNEDEKDIENDKGEKDGEDGKDGGNDKDSEDVRDGQDGKDGDHSESGIDRQDSNIPKDEDTTKKDPDNVLPKTATPIFNVLFIGLILLVTGSLFLVRQRA